MKVWIDAQISPTIAQWLSATYQIDAVAIRDLRLRDATDRTLFHSARESQAIVLTKDRDLVDLVIQLGQPPQILWVTCGNTSNTRLKAILAKAWPSVVALLGAGEKIVEVSDTTS